MDRTEVGVLKKSNKVGLRGFLKRENRGRLEAKVALEVLRNLTNETLERSLANKKVRGFLILADLTESNSSRTVTVRLLDTSGGRGALAGGLVRT
jgi:hypothetical protein